MNDINKVTLIGRVVSDLGAWQGSWGKTTSGIAKGVVSIAINRSKKNKAGEWTDEAHFFNVTIWGKQAESLKPYLLKGKQVAIEGHLQQTRWEKDGQKHSRVDIVADDVQLLGSKGDGVAMGASDDTAVETRGVSAAGTQKAAAMADAVTGDELPNEENIPF